MAGEGNSYITASSFKQHILFYKVFLKLWCSEWWDRRKKLRWSWILPQNASQTRCSRLKSTAVPRFRPRCHILSFIKNTLEHYNVQFPSDCIYSVHPIFLKVSDQKRMPVGHVVIGIVVFKYYDLLWRILLFLNKIIILCIAKLQYVPWNARFLYRWR